MLVFLAFAIIVFVILVVAAEQGRFIGTVLTMIFWVCVGCAVVAAIPVFLFVGAVLGAGFFQMILGG